MPFVINYSYNTNFISDKRSHISKGKTVQIDVTWSVLLGTDMQMYYTKKLLGWSQSWVVDVACSVIFEANHTWYIECSERARIITKQAEEKALLLSYTFNMYGVYNDTAELTLWCWYNVDRYNKETKLFPVQYKPRLVFYIFGCTFSPIHIPRCIACIRY